jgi:DNA segregation ATPase FtsK/SpoIIIE, S-DNA-T family
LAGQASCLHSKGTVHYLCFMANKLKSNTPAAAEKPVVKEKAEKVEKASKPKPAAKKKPAPQKLQNDKEEKVDLKKLAKDERTWKIIGTVSLLISIFLFIAFVSYLFTWDDDQSQVLNRGVSFLWDNDKENEVSNLLGRL